MSTKTKYICFLGLILLFSNHLFSQVNVDLRPQVKSPEVSKFEQYLYMPVNLVSGTPQVSIPIYTLEYGGMKLPISLEYDASGVKVESIASAVGLNWSLNVGGAVSRTIKSAPDEGSAMTYSSGAAPFNIRGYYLDYGLSKLDTELNLYNPASTKYTVFNEWISDVNRGLKDGQPDLFSFSTPEGGSKFIFNDQRQVVYLENTDFFIKENFNESYFKTWTATSPNGIKYKFGLDTGTSFGNNNYVEKTSVSQIGEILSDAPFKTTSWFLSEVSNYQNNKTIRIEYVDNIYSHTIVNNPTKNTTECLELMNSGSQCTDSETGQYYTFAQNPLASDSDPGNMISASYYLQNHIKSKVVSKIIAGNYTINFIYSNRDDVAAESGNYGKKLEEITIYNLSECIKKIKFNYTTLISNNDTNNNDITNLKRLQLDNIVERNVSNLVDKTYSFVYNSTALPSRLSFSQDKWGYFNGKSNVYSMFPKRNFYDNVSFPIADRGVDINYSKAGSLEKIVYPTKGIVEFTYENHLSNVPTDIKVSSSPIYTAISNFSPGTNNPVPNSNAFTNSSAFTYHNTTNDGELLSLESSLMFPSPLNGSYNYSGFAPAYCSPALLKAVELIDVTENNKTIGSINYSELDLVGFTMYGQTQYYCKTQSIKKLINPSLLIEGHNYQIKVFGYGNCFYNTTKLNIYSYSPSYEMGGLRIQKITHKNHDNSIAKQTNYNYLNPKTVSNPKTMTKVAWDFGDAGNYGAAYRINIASIAPQNAYSLFSALHNNLTNNPLYKRGYYYMISSGTDPLEINNIGPNISYATVEETDSNGKIVHNYYPYKNYFELNNYTEPQMPPLPKFQNAMAGTESNVIVKDNNGTDLKSTNYYYNYASSSTSVKGIVTYVVHAGLSFFNSYTISGQIKTLKTEVESSNLNGQSVTTQKDYEYNGNGHFQPTKITSTNSKGEVIETKIKYPQDLPNELFMSDLILQNRKTPVVTENYLGNTKTFEQRTTFLKDASTSNYVLPKSVYAAKFPNDLPSIAVIGQLEKRVTSDSYDASGNLTQFTPEGGIPVSIIWGYNNTLPIAKIENTTFASIPASSITNLQSLSSTGTEADLIVALNNLRTSLPNAMITTYTHKPLIGVSSVTDTKGDVQSYHYDSFNRLQYVKDKDGNILSENQYHYKN